MILYHYTCSHVQATLGAEGVLQPHGLPGTPSLVWLTDLAAPMAEALGLTGYWLGCDRTEHRYRVTEGIGIQPWLSMRRHHPLRTALEAGPVRPMHWWVAVIPVPVVYDPISVDVGT